MDTNHIALSFALLTAINAIPYALHLLFCIVIIIFRGADWTPDDIIRLVRSHRPTSIVLLVQGLDKIIRASRTRR